MEGKWRVNGLQWTPMGATGLGEVYDEADEPWKGEPPCVHPHKGEVEGDLLPYSRTTQG